MLVVDLLILYDWQQRYLYVTAARLHTYIRTVTLVGRSQHCSQAQARRVRSCGDYSPLTRPVRPDRIRALCGCSLSIYPGATVTIPVLVLLLRHYTNPLEQLASCMLARMISLHPFR